MKVIQGLVLAFVGIVALAMGLLVMTVVAPTSGAIARADGQVQGVPAGYQQWLDKGRAECGEPELTPALLAAQIDAESHFNARAVSPAGALGAAQFVPGTWAMYGRDSDHNGKADPHDVGDAVMAQARYMCSLIKQAKSSAISGDVRELALAGYNAGWGTVIRFQGVPPKSFARGETYNYVHSIMSAMKRFEAPSPVQASGSGSGSGTGGGSGAAALRKATGRLGTPYAWGGGSPQGPSTGFCDDVNGYAGGRCLASTTTGFDCSSLVQYAYWPAVKLPRTASEQYAATAQHPVARADLQPGDLMFWRHGRTGSIYHVALYAGSGQVLHAPRTGRLVETTQIGSAAPAGDYLGATRP